jgi:hypothetical protein
MRKAKNPQTKFLLEIADVKNGKHFFWTSLHVFWTWKLLLDLTTILLEMPALNFGPAHPPAGPHPSLLLDLALSQTKPPLDRFSSFCPAASASKFFRQ